MFLQQMLISELKKLQEQLIEASKIKALGQLAVGVAHEFNNIFAITKATAQLILNKTEKGIIELPADFQGKVWKIIEHSRRGKVISANLLDIGKPKTLKKQLWDIIDVIEKILIMQTDDLNVENIKIMRKYYSRKKMMIDWYQMEQVFYHLIINVRHAMKKFGQGVLTIVVKETEENIIIRFTNSGIDMNEEIRERIFELFLPLKVDITEIIPWSVE